MTTRRTLTDAEREMADLLRRTIRSQGITQEQLAARLGVTQGVVWQWINGRIAISPEKAVALAEALGLEPGQLSARHARIVEGTGHGVLKFARGAADIAHSANVVRDDPGPAQRPAVARLLRAITVAERAGTLSDQIAASLAALIESLPKAATGGHG